MPDNNTVLLAGCTENTANMLSAALNHAGWIPVTVDTNVPDFLEKLPKSAVCLVLFPSPQNLDSLEAILQKFPHEFTPRLFVADTDFDIEADVVLAPPVGMQETLDAINDLCDEVRRRQLAWGIEQYKKNHADELPPDVWKAQTLARLQKQSRARVDRLNQRIVVGISLLIGLFLIIWLVSMIAA